jgi:hypothetical protein
MSLETIKAELIAKNPTLQSGSDEDGYVEITGKDYDAVIENWAKALLDAQAKEAAEEAAATAKAALLERLGITTDEAKLLLS